MTQTKKASEIDAEAAQWVARIDRGPLSSSAADAFRLWIEGDSRHLGAFGRIRAISLASEKARALGSDFDRIPGISPVARPSRRQLLVGGGAIAASVLVAGATGVGLILRRHPYVTGKGEMKVVALSDGSVITLNTGSEIAVEFTEATRAVRLVRGEALFDVAKNAKCPFVVRAGDTRVQVVGTSFTVRNMEALPVEVLVREGIVEVSDPANAKGHVVRITANTRAIALQGHSAISAVPIVPAELHRELAWKDGLLAFEGQSLASAAAEFARYSDTRIVIADSDLAQEEIAGLFKATDPVGFAQTVAASFKAHVIIRENEVWIVR
jgi:transmembrane sensor